MLNYINPRNTDENGLFWWHSILFPNGRVTPGFKSVHIMNNDIAQFFGDMNLVGKSFLDVGAWNGGFSVEAHRRGATKIAAIDSYVWNDPQFRGRETIELVQKEFGFKIDLHDIDLDQPRLNLESLGKFDVTLFAGVFYHLIDPIAALRELCAITTERIIVETYIEPQLKSTDKPMMLLYPNNELFDDYTNWWAPNPAAVAALLKLFGFEVVQYFDNNDRGVFHAVPRVANG